MLNKLKSNVKTVQNRPITDKDFDSQSLKVAYAGNTR